MATFLLPPLRKKPGKGPRMADDDKRPDVTDSTVTQFLRITSNDSVFPNYDITGRGSLDESGAYVGFGASPDRNSYLPEVSADASVNEAGDKTGSLSMAVRNILRYSKRLEEGPGGLKTTDTFEGNIGNAQAFYSQSQQPDQDLRTKTLGGSLEAGPMRFYAQREKFKQNVIPSGEAQSFTNPYVERRTDTIGAGGSFPLGPGTVRGDINRQYQTNRGPQHISQGSRPTSQSPNVTELNAGYEGLLGGGILGLRGRVADVRGVGTDKSLDASYNKEDPFGLGGNISASASYINPLGGDSEKAAYIRWTLGL
jgi:hypothetical protein